MTDEENKLYPVRGIHCYNNEECGVIMNRDYNAAINIHQNLINYINQEENGVIDSRRRQIKQNKTTTITFRR